MSKGDSQDKFREYLKKIKNIEEDKCWLCCKTPDDIRMEFYEYMQDPEEGFEEADLDDIAIMSYKLKKPICAGCYFILKHNPGLVKEVLGSSEEEVW